MSIVQKLYTKVAVKLILALLVCSSPAFGAFRASGSAVSAAAATATLTPGSPAGLAANDIILCFLSVDAAGAAATFASGFTQLNSDSISTPDGQTFKLAWKRAVGGDTLTITGISTTGTKVGQCSAWSGRDTGNPPVTATSATNSSSNASPTTVTSNGVTALASDDLAWFVGLDVSVASATNTLTPPTGYTNQGAGNDGSSLSPIALASKDNVGAGATGTVAGSITHSGNAGWGAYLVRIPAVPSAAAGNSMLGGPGMVGGPSQVQ